jgi:hypothetical protein
MAPIRRPADIAARQIAIGLVVFQLMEKGAAESRPGTPHKPGT